MYLISNEEVSSQIILQKLILLFVISLFPVLRKRFKCYLRILLVWD